MDKYTQYLQYYRLLSDPEYSSSANAKIMEMQSSQQAWNIAYTLLQYQDHHSKLLGASLLSVKLSQPLSPDINPQYIFNFLCRQQKSKNSNIYVCMAKVLTHCWQDSVFFPTNLSLLDTLMIIKQVPSALKQTKSRYALQTDDKLVKQICLLSVQKMIEGLCDHLQIVIECIDSFVCAEWKIQSPVLLGRLFNQNSNVIGQTIISLFKQQGYNELFNQFLMFAQKCMRENNYKLAFSLLTDIYKKQDILQYLQLQVISSHFQFMIYYIKNNQHFQIFTEQTYKFCIFLSKTVQSNKLRIQLKHYVIQFFKLIWEILISQLMFVVIPQFRDKSYKKCIILDLNTQQHEKHEQKQIVQNNQALNNRKSAGDILYLIIKTSFSLQNQLNIIKTIQSFSLGNMLQLQFLIYIFQQISNIEDDILNYFSSSLFNIFKRKQQVNQYIISKLTYLISNLHQFCLKYQLFLNNIYQFFTYIIKKYPNFIPLAADNIVEFITMFEGRSQNHIQILQKFTPLIQYIFQTFSLQSYTVDNLIKARVTHIIKYKSQQYYEIYLKQMINSLNKYNLNQKIKIISALITTQLFINAQLSPTIIIKSIFQQFLIKIIYILHQNINLHLQSDDNLHSAFVLVSMCFRTNCIYKYFQTWCEFVHNLFSNLFPSKCKIINIVINLIRSLIQLNSQQIARKTIKFIVQWLKNTNIYLQASLNSDYLSLFISFNLKILQYISKYNINSQINYNPLPLLNCLQILFSSNIQNKYQSAKNGLQYFRQLISLGFQPKSILKVLFKQFQYLQQNYFNTFYNIITLVHSKYQFVPIKQAFIQLNFFNNQFITDFQVALTQDKKYVRNFLINTKFR